MTRWLLTIVFILSVGCLGLAADSKPNVIFILADDIGYGDLGCYGATHVKTPNLDRLAKEGRRFTDGHTASATCTPTRYALMTGQYPWRKKGTGILTGNANLIIEPGRVTLASMLQSVGYRTAAVGKWHLGFGDKEINWNEELKPGPREIGFDYSFLIPATGDRTPCVYVENQRVVGHDPADPILVGYGSPVGNEPTGKERPDLLKMKLSAGHDQTIVNGISRIGYMTGGNKARWVDEDMGDVITAKAVKFIEANAKQPFFLYFATHDIHVPRVPHPRFKGTSQCGIRGDAIHQLDANVGTVLETLDRLKISENTIVIFSSDNGPVLDDGYADGAVSDLNGHKPAGPLKGTKYSLYEAGTRVPFILRWPQKVKPGTSAALVCQIDLLASFAKLTNAKLPEDSAPDSFDILQSFVGDDPRGREYLVEHANGLAIRKGEWKFIPENSGAGKKGKGAMAVPQLFNLSNDLGEEQNIATQHPNRIAELTALLDQVKTKDRSRP